MNQLQLIPEDKFITRDNVKMVSSRTIAEIFEKEHHNVLRDIQNNIKEIDSVDMKSNLISSSYFIESSYIDKYGRNKKEYLLTKDGFVFTTMGYTGKKATKFKVAFINTFNMYEKMIQEQLEHDLSVFVNNNGTVSVSVTMNKIGGSPQALYKILEAHDIIYRTEIYKGTRKHRPIRIKSNYYKMINKEFKLSMDLNKLTQLRITSIGEIWIRNFLTKHGYMIDNMFDRKGYKQTIYNNTGKVV